ncbi:helix-turn-helix domain-containing protein [Gordonia shandongensis]|uniref:helix-turn-helix domain-containing protein n=1 Tax=Gordonia shandongensis TaxID=376351 RepID=UPI0009FD0E5B
MSARRRESGFTIEQIATDFGISEATLQNWLRQADAEEGNRPGPPVVDDHVQRVFRADAPNRVWLTA